MGNKVPVGKISKYSLVSLGVAGLVLYLISRRRGGGRGQQPPGPSPPIYRENEFRNFVQFEPNIRIEQTAPYRQTPYQAQTNTRNNSQPKKELRNLVQDKQKVSTEQTASYRKTPYQPKTDAKNDSSPKKDLRNLVQVKQKIRTEKTAPCQKTPYQGPDRRFGHFKCLPCGRTWQSALSWANKGQGCQRCGNMVYPYRQDALLIPEENKIDPDKSHDVARCEKCKELGCPCYSRKPFLF